MKYQLVIQTPETSTSFDQLMELEERLISFFGDREDAEVDGHDFGNGEGNIFIHTNDPERVFADAKFILHALGMKQFKAAYRELKGDTYSVLWPNGLRDFKIT